MTCKACLRRMIASRPTPVSNGPPFVRSFASTSPALAAGYQTSTSCGGFQPSSSSSVAYDAAAASSSLAASQSPLFTRSSPLPRLNRQSRRLSARSYATIIPYPMNNDMSSSKGSQPPPPSSPPGNLEVRAPSLDAIKEEGYLDDDVKLVPENEAYVILSKEAVDQLVKITSREKPETLAEGKLALRVGVDSGGCHGYQYTMAIVEERGVDDYVMQPKDIECIPVIVDLVSLGLLKGSTLHFSTELIGSSFSIQSNPQAKQGGNCGCGISWELA